MNTTQRIAKNTIVLGLAELLTTIVNFFFFMYVARYLGAKGFGVLSFAFAFTAIFTVFTDVGLNALTIREVARDRSQASRYLGNVAGLKMLLCVATFGVMAVAVNLLGYPRETINVVYLVGAAVILTAFSTMFYSIFQANERMEFVTVSQVIGSVALLGGSFLAIGRSLGVTAFAAAYLAAAVITLGYSTVVSARSFTRMHLEFDLPFWKETLKLAWPFGLTAAFAGIFYWMSSVMLSMMQGDEAVGWYSVAYRLVVALLFIPGAFARAIFPVMSRLYISSEVHLRFTYERSTKYMIAVAVPLGVGTTMLADRAVRLILGADYAPSVLPLQILIWSTVFIFVSSVLAEVFKSVNRQMLVTAVMAVSALVNVPLNFILIPRYSYVGASIATLVTEFVALVLVFVLAEKIGYGLPGRKVLATLARVVVASAAMAAFIFYQRDLVLWWLVPLAVLLYFATLYLIREVDKEDVVLLRRMLRRHAKES